MLRFYKNLFHSHFKTMSKYKKSIKFTNEPKHNINKDEIQVKLKLKTSKLVIKRIDFLFLYININLNRN